jgi:tRNA dimethylallyltransferase
MIYLTGPTAVGKSAVAAELAAQLGGEVVGADAFQVYRGLDILTAKPDAATLARAPHHLIGSVPLAEVFDVAGYRRLAQECLTQIAARGRPAIIAGGTGLYVRALARGLAELPSAHAALRAELATLSLSELIARLQRLDPASATQIDLRNPRRVLRAVEVCLLTGRPFSSFRQEWAEAAPIRGVLLTRPRAELQARIAERTDGMFRAGVVEEVRIAGAISPTAAQAIGLREIRALLAGEMSERVCRELITLRTRQYAKRQLTWFRREPGLLLLEIAPDESATDTAARCRCALGL